MVAGFLPLPKPRQGNAGQSMKCVGLRAQKHFSEGFERQAWCCPSIHHGRANETRGGKTGLLCDA